MLRMVLLTALAAVLCGCWTTREAAPGPAPGQGGHTGSGIRFPATLDRFVRGRVRAYDGAGKDVGVGYDLADLQTPVAVTLYVYPAPRLVSIGSPEEVVETAKRTLLDGHFAEVKASILRRHQGAKLLSEGKTTLRFRGSSLHGRAAAFGMRSRFAHRVQPVVSHLAVFSFGKWLIKFRITHPARCSEQAQPLIKAFRDAFCRANKAAP